MRHENFPIKYKRMYDMTLTQENLIIGENEVVIRRHSIITVIEDACDFEIRVTSGRVILSKVERLIKVCMR